MSRLYNFKRSEGTPSSYLADIQIFLESWWTRCEILISSDNFLKPFSKIINKIIKDIDNSQTLQEKNLRIQELMKDVHHGEKQKMTSLLKKLISIPPPRIFLIEEYLSYKETHQDDIDFFAGSLISFQKEADLSVVRDDIRSAVVHIQAVENNQEKIKLLDDLISTLLPEFFGNQLTPPPYDEELKDIFSQTRQYLSEIGITSILVDIGIPDHLIKIFHNGVIKAIFDYQMLDDFFNHAPRMRK